MRLLRTLAQPALARLWAGLSLSAMGDQLNAVALAWIAVALFGRFAGYLAALTSLIVLLTASFAGPLADRMSPRRAMLTADLARAASLALLLAAWGWQGGPQAAPLVLMIVVLAGGQAVFRPALQAALPSIAVDRSLLPAANALLDMTDRTARLVGPALIGLLAGIVSIPGFFAIDLATFAASALCIACLGKMGGGKAGGGKMGGGKMGGGVAASTGSLAAGIRALRAHALLWRVLLMTGPVNGAWYALIYLGVPLALARSGASGAAGLGDFGLVISSYGATNLLAMLVVGSREIPRAPARMVFPGVIVVGSGMMVMALAACYARSASLSLWLAAGAAVGAIGGPLEDIPVAVLRQTDLAPGDIAASTRAFLVVSNAGILVAMLVAPVAVPALGIAGMMLACAVVILACGGTALASAWRAGLLTERRHDTRHGADAVTDGR